jgi:hypothetical protein
MKSLTNHIFADLEVMSHISEHRIHKEYTYPSTHYSMPTYIFWIYQQHSNIIIYIQVLGY